MKSFVTGIALIAAVAAVPALAAEQKHTLRFGLAYVSPTGDGTEGSAKWEYDGSIGAAVGYEYRTSPLIGIDATLKYFSPDTKVNGEFGNTPQEVKAKGKIMPLTAGLMFHLTNKSKVDVYVGPELAYVWYKQAVYAVTLDNTRVVPPPTTTEDVPVDFKNELTWGVKAGIDVPFSPGWAFNAQLEYIDAKAKTDIDPSFDVANREFNIKPLIITAGVAWKF